MIPKVIAFYLPQFHPTINNNKWYGEGFTEWTNLCKAKKLFPGHKQPNIPADLGFYDLRLPETRKAQADLAKKHGIHGFCYYHYRFNSEYRELDLPFNEVLKSGEPNFPFMLCWVNESWYKKYWSYKGNYSKKILAEQIYEGIEDYKRHFFELLPAFIDTRYIRIDDKPVFLIYKPLEFADVNLFISCWQDLAKKNGLNGIFFISRTTNVSKEKDLLISKGFSAVYTVRLGETWARKKLYEKIFMKTIRAIIRIPHIISYSKAAKYFVGKEDEQYDVFPTIIPNFDHTPRSGRGGVMLFNSTPQKFYKHMINVMRTVKKKPVERQIAFLLAWNEWGEGNYMEPDIRWGKRYLEYFQKGLSSGINSN